MTITMRRAFVLACVAATLAGCGPAASPQDGTRPGVKAVTFGDDLAFLRGHVNTIVLSDKAGQAKVAVVGPWQGRVMTSTAEGDKGPSFGWINRELISSGKTLKHINPYGGEDRIWLGPEGGQFSIYFPPGATFEYAHWQTPPAIDTEPFQTVSADSDRALFRRRVELTNYSGTKLDVEIAREVRLLTPAAVKVQFGLDVPKSVKTVAYESANSLTNRNTFPWTKKTGMLSVWILGMYVASPANTVVVPFVKGPEDKLGKIVTDDYFGKVPAERLKIDHGRGVIYFKADAKYRSKIGLSPKRAKKILGSYDAANHALTLVTYTKPKGVTDYVNSLWKLQEHPFAGDAVNSYSDGLDKDGKQLMGAFYEIESSSPAAALKPGQTLTHVHTTAHFVGPEADLDKLARKALGVGLAEIKAAIK